MEERDFISPTLYRELQATKDCREQNKYSSPGKSLNVDYLISNGQSWDHIHASIVWTVQILFTYLETCLYMHM